jgi:hypothetical protein
MTHKLHAIVLGTGLSVFAGTPAAAQSGPALMLAPWQPDQTYELRGEGFYTPTESDVTGVDVDLSIFDAQGRVRLDPDSSYDPTLGFSFTQFNLGTTDAALPDRLVDVSVGFGGSFGAIDLGDALGEWQMGYTLGLGYAGTAPFNDGNAWYGKATVYGVKPVDQDHRWLVAIDYDGHRAFLPDVPLPAVTYFGRLSETVTYGLGFPFSSLRYTPNDVWTVELRSAVFISFTGKVSYKVNDRLSLFAAYVRRNDVFVTSGLPDNRRLLFSQERAELGLRYELGNATALTVAGGYAFGQEFDVGYDVRDPSGLRDLDDSGYIRAGIELRF